MRYKDGLHQVARLRAPILEALPVIDAIHRELTGGLEATVTSTTDGKHSVARSAHYRGDAVDLRIWHVDPREYTAAIKEALGEDFVVIHEHTHIHVHWSPVYHDTRA